MFEKYIQQPAPDQKIWRYMDFTKFMSLVDTKALFLPQAKRLGDKFEGYIPNVPFGSDLWNTLRDSINDPNMPNSYMVITCWHMSDYESAAMWKQYLTSQEGIAIQTTVERLEQSLNLSLRNRVFRGQVNYREPKLEPGESASIEFNYFHKRKSFEHEREYRVLLHSKDLNMVNQVGGEYVDVELIMLIERVYIAPGTPKWFTQLVESVMRKQNIKSEVVQSELDKDWLY
jgi:hypothetical protein